MNANSAVKTNHKSPAAERWEIECIVKMEWNAEKNIINFLFGWPLSPTACQRTH